MKHLIFVILLFFTGYSGYAQSGATADTAIRCSLDRIGASGINLIFESEGCFSHVGRLLQIKKEGKQLIARLYSVNPERAMAPGYDPEAQPETGVLLDSAAFGAEQVQAFCRFEQELGFKAVPGGCTTRDLYRLQVAGLVRDAEDGTCSWNGFRNLLQAVFGPPE